MNICIITARGGSKRIPRKNIKEFCGRPMLSYPIQAAKDSGLFKHILVSTDDEEIAQIAKNWGAEIPFIRPANLADDFAHAHKAARHALEWAINNFGTINFFCHLYPTAPMLSSKTIKAGYEFITAGASQAFAAMRVPFPIYQTMTRNENGQLKLLFTPEQANMRSQDMPESFIDAGQMYWFNTAYFLEHETKIDEKTRIVEISRERAVDIDTPEDWALAEKMAEIIFKQ